MKERLPYEKLIAEKMQGLPVPDKDEAWQKMETLLDSKMPVSLPPGRKLPGRQWWWGGAAVVTIVSTMLVFQNKAPVSNPAAPPTARVQPAEETIQQSHTTNPGNIEDRSTQNVPLNNISAKSSPEAQAREQENSITGNPGKDLRKTPAVPIPAETHLSPPASYTLEGNNKRQVQASPQTPVAGTNAASGNKTNIGSDDIASIISSAKKDDEEAIPGAMLQADSIASLPPEEKIIEGTIQRIIPENFPPLIVYADNGNTGHIEVPESVYAFPEVSVSAKKTLLRTLKHRDRKLERELAGSHKASPGFWGEKTDSWFAAGIAPYQNFAVASQQAFHYNANASHNTVADYIPSPYLQWKVTSKVYILSEFQFNAPQATPELLLSQRRFYSPVSVGSCTENVYLRKLYYFNLPVSFYYSPLKNFYIGSGLQYSSLNSGLAYLEQLAPNNNLIYSEVLKVKSGPLASKIKTSEWRYLFDANYFINRLMIGFRYNQAMGDYVNFRVSNWDAPTRARNQAFQFYLRYNIVAGKRH